MYLKKVAIILLIVMLLQSASPLLAATVTVPNNTLVQMELLETVSSNTAAVGQNIKLKVVSSVKQKGKVVIEGGAIAQGTVSSVDKSGMFGKPGAITIQIKSVQAVDGTSIPVSASRILQGQSKQTEAIVVTLLLCIFGLFIKGTDASLQAGSIIEATTLGEATVEIE